MKCGLFFKIIGINSLLKTLVLTFGLPTKICVQRVHGRGVPKGRDCSKHYHLKCNTCGKLIHLDCEIMATFTTHMENEHGFAIDLERTLLYGICVDCKNLGAGK